MRRALIWPLALPFAAVSILAGHAAAYALTGAPAGTVHGYSVMRRRSRRCSCCSA